MAISGAVLLWGCTAHGDNPGREYAPNMYHSVAYEPLSQIKDTTAGVWVNSLNNGRGEYFNSIKYNQSWMTMRLPAPNTVRRNQFGWLPYRSKNVPKDSIDIIVAGMKNPLDSTAAIVEQGKILYEVNCLHCHGAKGMGDGLVSEKFAGVANLKSDALQGTSEAHIFHVITYGAGLMGSHGSQVNPEERWKIAKYVKALQKQK
ncbi:cytochrome c [soil metagenome]